MPREGACILGPLSICRCPSLSTAKLPPLPDTNTFASELISARAERGLTQGQLSANSGLSLSTIKAYETGRNMPGARELRELCQTLQISPNKLLFGTEAPFKDQSLADLLVDSATESEHVALSHFTALASLLASDERRALITLARSLALARHGEAKVKETLKAADLMTGMGRAFGQLTRDSLIRQEPFTDEAISAATGKLEEFLDDQGHKPTPEKLPKK